MSVLAKIGQESLRRVEATQPRRMSPAKQMPRPFASEDNCLLERIGRLDVDLTMRRALRLPVTAHKVQSDSDSLASWQSAFRPTVLKILTSPD